MSVWIYIYPILYMYVKEIAVKIGFIKTVEFLNSFNQSFVF